MSELWRDLAQHPDEGRATSADTTAGWICYAANDPAGRRGLWARRRSDTGIDLCSGREGDDVFARLDLPARTADALIEVLEHAMPADWEPVWTPHPGWTPRGQERASVAARWGEGGTRLPCASRPCPRHIFWPARAECGDLSPAEIEQLRADAASVERLATVLPLAAHVARGARALAEQLGRTALMLGLEVAARGGRSERRQAEQDAQAVAAQGGVREHASAYTPFLHPDRVPDGEPFTGCGRCRNRPTAPGEAARPYHAPGCPADVPAQRERGGDPR